MIVKTEQDLSCKDLEILIRYANKTKTVDRLIAFLNSCNAQVPCREENAERLVNASDIYYIESVDKRTFVYLEKHVYRTDFRLYQLAADLAPFGFVQISKSCILNINTLEYIRPLINSRMEATLKNGERVRITRRYLSGIKQVLQGGAGL